MYLTLSSPTAMRLLAAVKSGESLKKSARMAGASPSEIVDVAIAVAPIAGTPRVVSAALRLAFALGCEDDLFARTDSDPDLR